MKYAVFVSSGLGDAVLMVPLIKKLKEDGTVVGFFDSTFQCQELFKNNNLFHEIVVLERNADYVRSYMKYKNKFDVSFLNYFSATRKNLLLATSLSRETRANRRPGFLPELKSSGVTLIETKKGIHNAEQNLNLLGSSDSSTRLNVQNFSIEYSQKPSLNDELELPPGAYFSIQISAANNIKQHKNWPINYWIELLKLLSNKYESYNFILIGEENETLLADQILDNKINRVRSFVGRTSILEMASIIRNSELFIGLDGGPMHIAVSQGTPTFTIWGASDYNLYGYQNIDVKRNQIIYKEISCHPCNSWIDPNTSRVMDPADCPDFACIRSLKPEEVFSKLTTFANQILRANAHV
ncbi:MAG: hypothetical protein COB85_05110 [Bacteroidetes bacterium]|nr:MAG: hypothetical protein COB85_05110 [Bacteroidota bacterium]